MWIAFFHFEFFPMWRCDYSDPQYSSFLLDKTMSLLFVFFFRLNIPPFVSARTVLEVLESEDFRENKIPMKAETTDTKVSKCKPQSSVFRIVRRSGPVICNTLPLLLVQDVRQEKAWKRERGEGWPAEAVPHCSSGGGETGCVRCLHSCSVSLMQAVWLCAF